MSTVNVNDYLLFALLAAGWGVHNRLGESRENEFVFNSDLGHLVNRNLKPFIRMRPHVVVR